MNSDTNNSGPSDYDNARQDLPGRDLERHDTRYYNYDEIQNPTPAKPEFDAARLDPDIAPRHDLTRQFVPSHDEPRHDPIGHDLPRQSTTGRDVTDETLGDEAKDAVVNWLDVEQAGLRLRDRGISRTTRTIQRLCAKGEFECKLVPTETGTRYIINENSIDEFVVRFNEKLPSGGFSSSSSAMDLGPRVDRQEMASSLADDQTKFGDTANADHAREMVDMKDQLITVLQSQLETANTQIAVKDEQISAFIERDHETNILIQNLQRLVALPEGRATQHNGNGPVNVEHSSQHTSPTNNLPQVASSDTAPMGGFRMECKTKLARNRHRTMTVFAAANALKTGSFSGNHALEPPRVETRPKSSR